MFVRLHFVITEIRANFTLEKKPFHEYRNHLSHGLR